MAITRLRQAGVETGNLSELDFSSSFTASASQKFTGAYSVWCQAWGIAAGWVIPATRQVRYGLFIHPRTDAAGARMAICDSAGTFLADLEFSGTEIRLDVAGVQQDVDPGGVATQEWAHWAIDAKIDAAAGWVKVYKGGVEVLSFAGNTGDSDIGQVRFGRLDSKSPSYNADQYFDDIYVDDTTGEGAAAPVPIRKFYPVFPTGAGNYTQFDPSAGANYECVDEVPASDADYVSTYTVDEFDSYAMDTIVLEGNETPIAVLPTVRARRASFTEEIAIGTRYSSTDLVGSDQEVFAGTFSVIQERQLTKPGGGAWDQAAIDGFELLMKSRGSY